MNTRRNVLARLSHAIGGVVAMALGAPALAFLSSPLRRRERSESSVPVGTLAQLREGEPLRVKIQLPRVRDAWNAFTNITVGAAWLVKRGSNVTALSTVCPHAGCAVDWDASAKHFACPCHGSVFDIDGRTTAGPSPRGMDELETSVDGGRISLKVQRFRIGVRNKEPM